MVDRDQTRRDAETLSRWLGEQHTEFEMKVKELVDALLSELDQADDRVRENGNVASELARNLDAAEARLAKVPALVEALRRIAGMSSMEAEQIASAVAERALADWEQE